MTIGYCASLIWREDELSDPLAIVSIPLYHLALVSLFHVLFANYIHVHVVLTINIMYSTSHFFLKMGRRYSKIYSLGPILCT